jgi:FOG: WD40 repeat
MEDRDENNLPRQVFISGMQKSKLLYKNYFLQELHLTLPNKEATNDVIYFPDKEIALIASFKKIIEYDLKKKQYIKVIPAHDSNVSCLFEVPNQYLLISGGYDGMLNVWEYTTWKHRMEFKWGGWIYQIASVKKEDCVAFLAGKQDERKNCAIVIWSFDYGEIIAKLQLEQEGLLIQPKMTNIWEGYEVLVADQMNQFHKVNLLSGEIMKLDLEGESEKRPDLSCMFVHEFKKKNTPTILSLKKLEELKTDQMDETTKALKEKLELEDKKSFPETYMVLLFVGDYKGKVTVYRSNRKFMEFKLIHEEIVNLEKQIHEIMVFQPRKNTKLILIRSEQELFLYDMDFTRLAKFTLQTTYRIVKSMLFFSYDRKSLLVASVKGDFFRFRMANLITYFLLKLKKFKNHNYNPYLYIDIFKMVFGHSEFLENDISNFLH